MNVRQDLFPFFKLMQEYVRNRTAIEELEHFFERWKDPVRPDESKPITLRLHCLHIMREIYDLSEKLNDLHELMSNANSKEMRAYLLQIVELWHEIRDTDNYQDLRTILQDELDIWLTIETSTILSALLNSYGELHQLLSDRENDCLSRDDARRLRQFAVLIDRSEFVVIMNYLSGRRMANYVEPNENIDSSTNKFINYFNQAKPESKVKFIVDLSDLFLGTSTKRLKRVDQNILFDKLNEIQLDRFRMFASNEGEEFNASREEQSIKLRVMEKAKEAANKRIANN